MDLLHGLRDKLRFIESMYGQASACFTETKRKIENSEGEFDYSGWDPDSYDGEPPFLTEWQEADEALNLLGQACLSLVQSALKEYLDGCLFVTRAGKPQRKGNESWFDAYQRFFNEQFGIDWRASPVHVPLIEEINLARNDAQHTGREFGMTRYQDVRHQETISQGNLCRPDVRGNDGAVAVDGASASTSNCRRPSGSKQARARLLHVYRRTETVGLTTTKRRP